MPNPSSLTPARQPPVVITLPAEIDVANACRIGEQLGLSFSTGTATVIADMTATMFCDSSGVRMLMLALVQAGDHDVELRLVVPSATVLRVLSLTGADLMLPIYPGLEDALTGHRPDSTPSPAPPPAAAC